MRSRPLLALMRTGTLSPREAARLHEHLASCSWCQQELAAYDGLDAAARQHLAGAPFVPLTLQENAYFQALRRVERYRLAGNTLALTSADGSVQMTFRAN